MRQKNDKVRKREEKQIIQQKDGEKKKQKRGKSIYKEEKRRIVNIKTQKGFSKGRRERT